MKLGTHNSWTFAKPIKWYLPHFIAKCQSVNIKKQYALGSRWFDLRLKLVNDRWNIAHGIVVFNIDWFEDLRWLNEQNGEIYIRVLLEYDRKPKNYSYILNKFIKICNILENKFTNLKLYDGRCKWDWTLVYDFKIPYPEVYDRYSSTTSLFNNNYKILAVIDDWWPWLYAKLNNKKNFKEFCQKDYKGYLLLDFINLVYEN